MNKGGVGYEKAIVTGEVFQGTAPDKKFVPLLRVGMPSTSLPSYLKSKAYVDFRKGKDFEESFESLLRHIFNSPKHVRPQLGRPPSLKPVKRETSDNLYQAPTTSSLKPLAKPTRSGRATARIPKTTRKTGRPSLRTEKDYNRNVFINCPFDLEYKPILNAILFTVISSGFRPRSVLEISDVGESRFQRIFTLVSECKFGIHDISHTSGPSGASPRLNTSFELGIFMGAQRFDQHRKRRRFSLILDKERHRYQAILSDISGQDIMSHDETPKKAMGIVTNWLRATSGISSIPGTSMLWKRYERFLRALPSISKKLRTSPEDLTFKDHSLVVASWLETSGELTNYVDA